MFVLIAFVRDTKSQQRININKKEPKFRNDTRVRLIPLILRFFCVFGELFSDEKHTHTHREEKIRSKKTEQSEKDQAKWAKSLKTILGKYAAGFQLFLRSDCK